MIRALERFTVACVVCFALFVATCRAGSPEEAKALWVLLAKTATKGVLPAPEPEPISDICENCNGRGWLGDGTEATKRTCPVCDGTGKRVTSTMPIVAWPANESIEIVEEPEPIKHALIEVYHRDDCPACDKLIEMTPDLQDGGWTIVRRYASEGLVPRSVVWLNGNRETIDGYESRRTYFEGIRKALWKHSANARQSLMHDQ